MMWRILLAVSLAALAVPPPAPAEPPPAAAVPCADEADSSGAVPSDSELKTEVPALTEFHEVVAVLWHDAWPNQDVARMKELLPEVRSGVAKVREASLPGILREKEAAWNKGVDALAAALTDYEQAAVSGEKQALLDAVETLHARFEDLVWTVRPVMKELGAYHVELYKVYHRYLPGKDLESLRAACPALTTRCTELAGAAAPRWFQGNPKALAAEIASLCTATDRLRTVATSEDWKAIEASVEAVHTQYRKVESQFE